MMPLKRIKTLVIVFALLCAVPVNSWAKGESMDVNVTIGSRTFKAVLEDNAAAHALVALAPLELKLNKWDGNKEYYIQMQQKFDVAGIAQPKEFLQGDLAIYSGISLVIFYGKTGNTGGYVKIGHVENPKDLESALDKANGLVKISIPDFESRDDESQIQERYRAMYRAMIAKDMSAMKEIHDESFVLVHMTGSRMNQKEYLDAVKDGTLNYYTAAHDEISVDVDGDRATLRGRSRVNAAVYGGGRHTWRLQQDMKLKKVHGKWKFTFSQASTY